MDVRTCSYCNGEPEAQTGDAVGVQAERPWASWLGKIEWSAFVTLTFKHEPDAITAMQAVNDWTRQVEQKVFRDLPYVVVVETTPRLHVHGLLALPPRRFVESVLEDFWSHGRTHVHEAPGARAVRYVGRKIVKEEQVAMPSNLWTRNRKLRSYRRYGERLNTTNG